MQLHQLKPKTARRSPKRIGLGGKRGKTSGKGGKGQTARAGNSMRAELRDFIKKLPKLRGFGKNRARTVNNERVLPVVVNVSALEAAFDAGTAINPKAMVAAGLIRNKRGSSPAVKILGNGELSKKFTISGCQVSASAREKIEKVGGTVA